MSASDSFPPDTAEGLNTAAQVQAALDSLEAAIEAQ